MSDQLLPDPAVRVEELDDGLCLYHQRTDEVLVLNQTAADIWLLLDTAGESGGGTSAEVAGLSEPELLERLAAVYDRTVDELAPDVRAVLVQLATQGFLQANPTASGGDDER